MKSHILFQGLSESEIQTIVEVTEKITIPKGTKVVEQDEETDCIHIIQTGEVDVYCEYSEQSFGSLQSGGVFGEMALLYGENAPHSFVAKKSTVVWRIDQQTFRHIMTQNTHGRDSDIRSHLSKIPLFKSLGDQALQKFATSLTTVNFKKGERIVKKGEVGNVFYLIDGGLVRVHDIGIGDGRAVDQFLKEGGM